MGSRITESTRHVAKEAFGVQPKTDAAVNPIALTIQQVVILIASILIMIVVLQIPTILYYNDKPSEPTIPSFGIDFGTCSVEDTSVTFPSASITEFCPEVPPLLTQNELFYNICLASSLTLLQSIDAFSSVLNNEQCNNSALPFICNATRLLCGDGISLEVDIQDKCVEIRDYDCAVEWRALENIFDAPLPDCTSFTVGGNITFSIAPPLVCPDEFDKYCDSFCLPSCKRFSQVSWNAIIISNIVTISLIALSLLGGVCTLIVCILNRKNMFQFPQIFIVYNTLILIFILLFIVPPLIFGHSIFHCSDPNALEAFNNPTGYCQAQGFVLHTGILCFTGFLLFHMAHLLFILAFPFKAKNFMSKYSKIAHIVEVIVVFVFSVTPGTVVFGISKYQFDRFPPFLCYPSITIFFYTFTLPLQICATIGLAMLFSAFLFLRRDHQLKAAARKSEKSVTTSKLFCIGFSTPEAKLLILFCCYFSMLLVILVYITINLNTIDSVVKILETYFLCSIAGDKSDCNIYREKIEDVYQLPYFLVFFSYVMISAINLGNLTFALHINEVKSIIKKCCA